MSEELSCSTHLKQKNIAAIRTVLYGMECATKKDIAAACGLSLAACTSLLAEMIADGQVLELSYAAPNGGRPARRFSLNSDYAHILCLYTDNNSFDSTGLALRIFDLSGNVLREKFYPLNDIHPDDLVALVTETVEKDPLIRAIGIGISGHVLRDGEIASCSFHDLQHFNPKKVLEEKLGLTVLTENDMYFASYGFYIKNRTDHPYSLSVLYWPSHDGAGAGSVVDGKVVVGSTKFAGGIICLPFPNGSLSMEESLSRMIRGDETVSMMGTAAICSIALINPDVIFITGSEADNVNLEDIERYCMQTVPKDHLPVFKLQANRHEEYMTGIFERAREEMPFKRL